MANRRRTFDQVWNCVLAKGSFRARRPSRITSAVTVYGVSFDDTTGVCAREHPTVRTPGAENPTGRISRAGAPE